MNLILFEEKRDRYVLARDDARRVHIVEVLGMKPGERIYIGAVNGPRALARIVNDAEREGMVLEPEWEAQSCEALPVTVLCGLPRPQTARRVLFEAACQGVRALWFFGAGKGEASYGESKLWSRDEWQRHLRQGAEQAFSTTIPEVMHFRDLDDCLKRSETCSEGLQRVALDVYEATGVLSGSLDASSGEWVVALGAERGWSASERDALRAGGFALAHLGERVLKVETALTAALSILRAKLGLM